MSAYLEIVFNRKNANNKSNKYTVNIRVTIARKQDYLSIEGFPKIEKQHWDKKRKEVKSAHPQAWQLNKILSDRINELYSYNYKCTEQNIETTIEGIKAFLKAEKTHVHFTSAASLYVTKRIDVVDETKSIYRTIIKHLDVFHPQLTLKEINKDFVENFISHLRSKKLKVNTIDKLVSRFGSMHRSISQQNDLIFDREIFKGHKLKREPADRFPLSAADLSKWEALRLTDLSWEYCRQIFTFMCHTGLYLSDVRLIKAINIKNDTDQQYIVANRSKNGQSYNVPLDEIALKIIERYGNSTGEIFNNIPRDEVFNKRLKMIADHAKIPTKITNKSGRHTFGDRMAAMGIPRAYLSKMMGHKKEETTGVYYELSDEIFFANISRFINR